MVIDKYRLFIIVSRSTNSNGCIIFELYLQSAKKET